MTYPITPNPSIHQQPKNIGGQNMVFTGGQLQQWAQQLPLAMTLQLMDAILKALGVSQSTIDSFNNQETAYYNAVQTELGTVNTDVAALQADSSASTAAFGTFLTSIESAITGYTNWSTFITAIENAWNTYSTTESGLTSSAIFTLQNLFNTLFGVNPSTGQISGSNISSSTGLASLQSDWNAWVANIQAGWNALWGVTTTPTTSSKVQSTSVASSLGGTNLNTDVTSVHTTAVNGSSWSTRLTNDLLVLSDVFHLTYAAGSPSDPPGTLSGGKPTWYSCWNDLLALCGVVNSTTAPTDSAPTTGSSITAAQASATTAGTNASLAIANAQAITDGIYQASNGGTTTGNPTSSVITSLTAIPASNVVGLTGAAVAFGSVGAGDGTTPITSSQTISWSETIATGDLGVVAFLSWYGSTSATFTTSATYGGTAMTSLLRETSSSGACLEAFWLKSPPSGSKTVSATVSASSGVVQYVSGNSASYSGSKVANTVGNTGGGTATPSMSASSATGHMVLGAFFCLYTGASITLSGFTQTQRGSTLDNSTAGPFIMGDVAGASSVSFGVTASHSLTGWCGITVDLSN